MQKELKKINENFVVKIGEVGSLSDLKNLERDFLGKEGALKKILDLLKTLDEKERSVIGKLANELRTDFKEKIKKKEGELLENAGDNNEQVDVSLPGKKISQGHIHPLTQTLENIKRVFESMGFSVFLAPEIETEFYNFDALNVPEYHPARDLWDTFWLKEGMRVTGHESRVESSESSSTGYDIQNTKLLLRTHTSAMQHHYMKDHNPPFRIITPGKCFRYEASDSSHDIQFFQIDGLVVDKDVSIANFKAIIEELFKRIFSNKVKVRMRPGYFPFVEPGFEIDIACYNCSGKDCPVCKGTGWLEVMGAGMVHPEVFKKAGYNPAHWQGFAFGMGVERIAMIKYGISDIRMFYQNDSRFLKQF
ncbi:MAG: phenylalanine--tRNA ligase subunit alpha [Candidatus Paceibacterota bacterium]|jgi:phenylalanyl-tRNA synthetase alpha chain